MRHGNDTGTFTHWAFRRDTRPGGDDCSRVLAAWAASKGGRESLKKPTTSDEKEAWQALSEEQRIRLYKNGGNTAVAVLPGHTGALCRTVPIRTVCETGKATGFGTLLGSVVSQPTRSTHTASDVRKADAVLTSDKVRVSRVEDDTYFPTRRTRGGPPSGPTREGGTGIPEHRGWRFSRRRPHAYLEINENEPSVVRATPPNPQPPLGASSAVRRRNVSRLAAACLGLECRDSHSPGCATIQPVSAGCDETVPCPGVGGKCLSPDW